MVNVITVYLIMANIYLQKQTYVINGANGIFIRFEISEDKIRILNENDDNEFVFDADNTVERLDMWAEVNKLVGMAIVFAKTQFDIDRNVNVKYPHPKSSDRKVTTRGVQGRKAKAK